MSCTTVMLSFGFFQMWIGIAGSPSTQGCSSRMKTYSSVYDLVVHVGHSVSGQQGRSSVDFDWPHSYMTSGMPTSAYLALAFGNALYQGNSWFPLKWADAENFSASPLSLILHVIPKCWSCYWFKHVMTDCAHSPCFWSDASTMICQPTASSPFSDTSSLGYPGPAFCIARSCHRETSEKKHENVKFLCLDRRASSSRIVPCLGRSLRTAWWSLAKICFDGLSSRICFYLSFGNPSSSLVAGCYYWHHTLIVCPGNCPDRQLWNSSEYSSDTVNR